MRNRELHYVPITDPLQLPASQTQPSTIPLPWLANTLKPAIPQHPDPLDGTHSRPNPGNIMSLLRHALHRSVIKHPLERDLVGHELVVQPRFFHCGSHVHLVLDDVPNRLRRGADDVRPARGAGGEEEGAVGVFYYHGGAGGQGPFAWADEVVWGGDVALTLLVR